jgi:hypothetical protein
MISVLKHIYKGFGNIVRTCKAAWNFDVRNHKAGEDTNTLITEFRECVGSVNLNYGAIIQQVLFSN